MALAVEEDVPPDPALAGRPAGTPAVPGGPASTPASCDERGPTLKSEGEIGAGVADLLRIAKILHAGKGATFGWGEIELPQWPDALKSDTTSRRTHLQAVLSQSGPPFLCSEGRFDPHPAVPVRRLIPSRSRPSWRNPGRPGETTFQIGICRADAPVSRPPSRESRTTDRPPERRTDLQTNVSGRRPGTARDRPPYPSLERRIAIRPRPIGAVRRRIDPQDAGSIFKTFGREIRTEKRRACRSTPQENDGRKERSYSAALSCDSACDGVAGGAGVCGCGFCSSGAFAVRLRPRNGCRPNSASFSDRMP